jgi:hypothetical protein
MVNLLLFDVFIVGLKNEAFTIEANNRRPEI